MTQLGINLTIKSMCQNAMMAIKDVIVPSEHPDLGDATLKTMHSH